MESLGRIGILGSGTWATALAKIILFSQGKINWFMRRQEQIDLFRQKGHNPTYLTDVHFDVDSITFFSDINEFVSQSDTLVLAVPSPFLKKQLEGLNTDLESKFIISAIKGIIPPENLLVTGYLSRYFNVLPQHVAIIGGPCHAEEIALERTTFPTVACMDIETANLVANLLENHYVKVSVSTDVTGIEMAAVMKNIYAIASGISHGLNFGDNFQAVLISYAMREMHNFIDKLIPDPNRCINESAYMGDLLVTAYSNFSRNRSFGAMIGRGYSIRSAQVEMGMVAEGFYGAKCVMGMNASAQIPIPVAEAVYRILYEGASAAEEIDKLKEKVLN